MNSSFEIFEVFSFNRANKAFEIFLSNGDSGYCPTIRRGPKQVATKGLAIIPKVFPDLWAFAPAAA